MSRIIPALFLLLYSSFIIVSCTSHEVKRNNQKLDAISNKREEGYKDNSTLTLLAGNVKKTTTYIYSSEVSDTNSIICAAKEVYCYDSIGNCIERLIYTDGKFDSRDVYKYDAKGHKIADYSYAEDGTLQLIMYKKFDPKGNLIEDGQRHASGAIVFNNNYEYDEWGFITKSTTTKVGDSDITYENSYDDEGILTEQVMILPDNKKGKSIYKFDSAGNVIALTRLMEDNTVFYSNLKKYNKKGFIIDEITQTKEEPARETLNTFDQYGNITQQSEQSHGVSHRIKYNVQYTYDSKGNWTKAISTQYPEQNKSTMLRYVEYYTKAGE
ncbi:MAG: hypothetical protein J7623_08040 [Chitinophaga sp.]|uniref:hypothetical protein n=1 Tax=Chitinophaga sp. TaxID=1869181 RepID=UPI001B223844|nr:hypothetical protein [Chitinophaga sp.]MBO9728571.1 hypothetical protein [Chitinophaga sp.]